MNGFEAQCIFCRHAKRRGTLPIACDRFPDPDDTQVAVNFILYRLASTGRCAMMEKFDAPADAYMAQDDPRAERTGDQLSRIARALRRYTP